jgi:hypothetical protein
MMNAAVNFSNHTYFGKARLPGIHPLKQTQWNCWNLEIQLHFASGTFPRISSSASLLFALWRLRSKYQEIVVVPTSVLHVWA